MRMANEGFRYVIEENELIISNGHERGETYVNTLKMRIDFEGKTECELDEIDYQFPIGLEAGDFAQQSDILGISCRISEGWTLQQISLLRLEQLRKEDRSARNREYEHVCFLSIRQVDQNYIYSFFAPAGWFFEKNPVFEVEFSDVVTTAAEGETQVGCEIYDGMTLFSSGTYTIRKKKQEEAVKIRDFYPDKGAASAGEKIRLNWKVENAKEVIFYADGQAYPQDMAVSSSFVSPVQSTRYRLEAKNGDASDQRETMIQILPVFLKTFQINEDTAEVEWEVLCAAKVTINGKKVSAANARSLKEFECPGKIVLTAEGTDTDIESVLYYGTPDERKDIVHFRKTITHYKKDGFQILNVEWQRYQVKLRDVAKSIRIVYQDRERNELYAIRGKDELEAEGSWEQILTGADPAHVRENILMTMNVHVYAGTGAQDYDITI
ncbi:MAG: hypothetical protein NC416_02880 [Eubacterium sp.]|nr:hypothetical protein [Eubacterium sp.]